MAKRKISFMASLVIAVSICSLCASTPAMALGKAGSGITASTDANGKHLQGSPTTVGSFDKTSTVRQVVIGHLFEKANEQVYREQCKELGLDFDRLYNGFEGIAYDYDRETNSLHFDFVTPRYGWYSMKSSDTSNTKTYWGYCENLNADKSGWIKSRWKFIGNKWYYFNRNGIALSSITQMIEGKSYEFGADCAWVQ